MSQEKNIIYGLIDPITNELKYIGQSSVGIRRAQKHYWAYSLIPESKNKQYSHKQRWILKLMDQNLKPEIFILEVLNTKEQLNEAEIFWIAYYKGLGAKLTNKTLGGNLSISPPPRPKGYKHTTETRQKISKVLKANLKPRSEEHKQFLRTLRLGQKVGPCKEETKKKISIANTGKKRTEECKLNASKIKDYKKIRLEDQFGNKYDSIRDAEKKTGVFKHAIRMQLKGIYKQNKGYTFKKI